MPGLAPEIRRLGLIGDRRTAAVVTDGGAVVWYCPGRFDAPSLLAGLLDPDGGSWAVDLPGAAPAGRRYLGDSGVLETRLRAPDGGEWAVTDWMPVGDDAPRAGLLCRLFGPAPADAGVVLRPRPDYARGAADPTRAGPAVAVGGGHRLYASHPLVVEADAVRFTVPAGADGWAVLADAPLDAPPGRADLERWLAATLAHWRALAGHTSYSGPYERAVRDSLRALRLLTSEDGGGIVAAATTSLPEVPGGERNYDYRYVWLRDAGMIVSALTRAGSDGTEERRFLGFVCSTRGAVPGLPLPPFAAVDGKPPPPEARLDHLAGYLGGRPVRVGNDARDQLQLDGLGNVLLAAKLIYGRFDTGEHREVMAEIADYLAANWREPDHGIWEESERLQYTASKVIVACGLDSIAEFTDDAARAARWRAAVRDIRAFVARECLTAEGAYAAVAGGEAVDVSAALFPVWAYTDPDTPEMLATMAVLERDHSPDGGLLYRRHLEDTDARREGAFLAGTFWVAQYWVMRRDLARAGAILEAGLTYANDLGLFAEEAEPGTGRMLGNFPQTFVHAALVGAVIDLKAALEDTDEQEGR